MRPSMLLSSIVSIIAVLLSTLLLPDSLRAAPTTAPAAIASVRYIYHGLGVRPPNQAQHDAHLKDPLFDQYGIRTQHDEKASIGFRDGTVLHMNQDTDAVLTAHLTQVRRGKIAEYLAPGTNHRIQTSAAVAAAIGTTFLVSAEGNQSTFVVLHGVVEVSNASGRVVVRSDQETSAVPGQAPQRPKAVDAKTVFGWTDTIPAPDLGENVALGSNGASIVGFSSQRDDANGQWHADHINDGLLSEGWETAGGQVSNQWVKIGFYGSLKGSPNLFRIQSVIIDPAATHGDSPAADLKDFEIRVSSTGKSESSFTAVFRATCRQENTLQQFTLPTPVLARYIELRALDNYGDPNHLAVAEMEVVGTNVSFAYPEGVALDARSNIYVADTGNDRIMKLSPSGQMLTSWGGKGSGQGQFTWPTDVAVNRQGDVYVLDAGSNNRVQEFSSSGQPLAQWGSFGSGPGQFKDPAGLTLDHSGNVYVIEHFSDRIQKFSPSGRPLGSWGSYGSRPGQFIAPQGIALDAGGNMYVADSDNNRIQKLSPGGKPLAEWGTKGAKPGQFNQPARLAVDAQGFIYVTDSGNNRIVKLSPSGKTVATWGRQGVEENAYYTPFGIVPGPHGTLYVTEEGNNRIKIISSKNGSVLEQFGLFGTVPQILGRATGVTVDRQGTVYVTDEGNGRLQIRSQDGSVLAVLGRRGVATGTQGAALALGQFSSPERVAVDSLGYIYVADTANDRIQVLSTNGPIAAWGGWHVANPSFDIPNGLTVDRQDNVYVADSGNNRIVKLSPQGTVLATFGTKGTAPGQFDFPTAVAVDAAGNMYVVDTMNNRIQKLSPDGAPLAQVGVLGYYEPGQFDVPSGIAVDSQGNVYVADENNDRIQKLSSDLQPVAVWGSSGSGEFRGPEDVAVDGQGNVYVADTFNLRIVKLSSQGQVLATWG